MYDVPVNPFACPGWSFYSQAADPRRDSGVQRNLARSDAPYWAATEWLLQGTWDTPAWRAAFGHTLADPRCRYLCVFNWESIAKQPTVLQAITETVTGSLARAPQPSAPDPPAPDPPAPDPPAPAMRGRQEGWEVGCNEENHSPEARRTLESGPVWE